MDKTFCVIIPARYKSSRLNGKPLADIKGIPMIVRTYNQCAKVCDNNLIWVATDDERIQRMIYEYDGGPKPKHYDNPMIVDQENFKKPPKKYRADDPSTYPSDRSQKQKLSTWDLIVDNAKGNPGEMREIRQILKDNYKNNPTLLTDKELKMIGKYKSKAPKVELPKIDPVPMTFIKPIQQTPDPETERLKQNYLRILEEDRKEKIKNATTGLAGLLGGMPIK